MKLVSWFCPKLATWTVSTESWGKDASISKHLKLVWGPRTFCSSWHLTHLSKKVLSSTSTCTMTFCSMASYSLSKESTMEYQYDILLNNILLTFRTPGWAAWRHSSPCLRFSWNRGGERGRGRPEEKIYHEEHWRFKNMCNASMVHWDLNQINALLLIILY